MYKMLDLFCGLGGWSDGFSKAGFDCTGVDIRVLGYPYRFINADLFDYEPAPGEFDVIAASPPCSEFSTAKYYAYGTQQELTGLMLVDRALALINKARPKFWILENVKHLSDFIDKPAKIVRYNKHPGGKRAYLWGKFPDFEPLPGLNHHHDRWGNSHPMRAKVPIEIALPLAHAVRAALA